MKQFLVRHRRKILARRRVTQACQPGEQGVSAMKRLTRILIMTFAAVALVPPLQSSAAPTSQPLTLAQAFAEHAVKIRASATTATAADCYAATITSQANGHLTSAELGYDPSDYRYGMLRARATSEGPWEEFFVCFNGSQSTIQSLDTGMYVSAELGYDTSDSRWGMLRARASSAGPWEQYSFATSCNGNCLVIRSTANNRLVSAELGYGTSDWRYEMLRARATSEGPWEEFN
jgi:hypothetical protein